MAYALLVIDMCNDFVTGKLKCDRALPVIPVIKKLIDASHLLHVPTYYLTDAHLKDDFELKIWGEHAMKGTKEAEIISQLTPYKDAVVLEKRTYSGFYETGLDELLRAKKVDTVVITGLHTNICDRHTSADAHFRGYEIIAVSDATNAFSEKDHVEGLEYLKGNYGAKIMKADEVIAIWKKEAEDKKK